MSNRLIILFLVAIFATSCSNQKQNTAAAPAVKTVLSAPFKFHKLIESSPGHYFDVVSWGRGGADTGSFLILHSDSTNRRYTTTAGDLNGTIVDVYNTDMDVDGNPEILIQAKKKDTINYNTIYAFEFNNGKANKLDFPKLTSNQRKGYRGNDNFYIRDGKLIREFTIFQGSGAAAKSTGAKRQLEYSLINNEINVKQLSKDSVDKKSATASTPAPQPKKEEKKKKDEGSSKKSKKHHEQEKPKKKKKHHRD